MFECSVPGDPCLKIPFQEKNCFNIYWKIKNFSYFWERIKSPEFTYAGDPRFLELHQDDINIISINGSQEASSKSTYFEVSKAKIFGERRNVFLPEDTLTVRCEFETFDEYKRGNVYIQSQIGVKHKSFFWNLDKSDFENRNKKFSIENSYQYGDIQLNLKSVGGINTDKKFYIDVSRSKGEKCYCVLKVSVLDNDGSTLNYVNDEFIFERGEQLWRFPPIIRNSKLLSITNLQLSNGRLFLKCDFAITLGKVSDETAIYSYFNDVIPLLKDYGDSSMVLKEETCSKDLKTDLKYILDTGTLSDVSLKVGACVFQAHKNILSARSPVFKAMFTKNMKEQISNTVVIEDADSETVNRLLLFMYTDNISDYQWENIMSLYFVADKYEVLTLKQKCSSFLKANVYFSNVCDILVLADLHQDAELKSVVYSFLTKYDSEVFASDAWKELEKHHSSLAFQTLKEMCSNKRIV